MPGVAPTVLFPNYTSDGTNISIPISSLPGLSAAEAHPTTGDGREVLRILIETAYQQFKALSTKPTRMTFVKQSQSGVSEDVNRQPYNLSFEIANDPTLVAIAGD
jgi:hypothetical protein